MEDVRKIFGEVKEENVELFEDSNSKEKIVRRDGIFL